MIAPSTPRLLETALCVDDLERAAAFYERALGLTRMLTAPRLIALRVEGGALLLFKRGACEADIVDAGGLIPGHGSQGRIHFAMAISTDDYEAWRVRLSGEGVVITGEYVWPRGGRSLYFSDPDGHVVELATPGLWPNY